ncbi:MAG TPA: glutamate-cysteine ligase family protein, partial [Bacteroidota bacterium]
MSTRPSFTLGIEGEYQTIDPVTRDLRSHIQAQIFARGRMRLQERVKPEMHGSVVEVGTGICRTIAEARGEVFELRRHMVKLAQDNNLRLAAAGRIRATTPLGTDITAELSPSLRWLKTSGII